MSVPEHTPRHARNPHPRRSRARRPRSRRFRLIRTAVLAIALVCLIWVGTSVGGALAAPGTDSVAARLAEWGRFHGLGWIISGLEKAQYNANKPKTGGTIAGGLPKAGATAAAPPPAIRGPVVTPDPAPLTPLVASPTLAGEGVWQQLYSVDGVRAAEVAFLRPDRIHTSYYVQVVWMDPKLVKFQLNPGYKVPGPPLTASDQIPANEIDSILATFNSGFTMQDAQGGYWQNGQSIVPLVTGAASMVFSADGTLSVEAWPGGAPGPGVVAVRQNLKLLISNGAISPQATQANASAWGATVGNAAYVWRSAIGIRADGSVISVVGPAMDIESLANILHAAGAVNAMELDINPNWTNYITYSHPSPGVAVPTVLPPPNVDGSPANRYLQPSSRDFVSVLPRAVAPPVAPQIRPRR